MLEAAIEAGAEDVQSDENGHVITCAFEDLGSVANTLEEKFGQPRSVKIVWRPNISTRIDEENAQTVMKLISALEDDDDVQSVFSNFEVSDEVMAKLTAA
jgi:transcriptional/translational regulatory protein YebC/TACO1